MKQFEMERRLIKIVAVTSVPEFRGDKRDYGCSVVFEMMFDNTILDEFDRDLRPALYRKDDGKTKTDDDGQAEMKLPVPDVKLTARKCPSIEMPIKLRKDLAGWQIVYHRGASEASEIKAGDVKFSDFQLKDACEGGSVLLRFKGYQKFPPELQGYVDHMAQTEVECTFRAPEAKQEDLVDQANKARKPAKKKTAAEKADEDPFANTDIPAAQAAAAKQASREGVAWPFPSGAAAQH